MASKIKSVYICSECGYESPKWYGKCPSCGEWNTMNEEIKDTAKNAVSVKSRSFTNYTKPDSINEISTEDEHRYDTGSKELNRVLGGGIVKGSLVLCGGEPGIGKSTLLLQVAKFASQNGKVLYVSGEESDKQIKLRAERLGALSDSLYVLNETDLESNEPRAKILEEIFKTKGLHEFKKAEFAKLVKENINSIEDISAEIVAIIEEMSLTNKVLDTEICS
jgi:DNA repair protein RadA/Sms